MNQVAGNQMRLYDLPSKLLCRVLNVELKVPSFPPCFSTLPRVFAANSASSAAASPAASNSRPGAYAFSGFSRRRRTLTRSTRRSCSCQSPR